MIGTATLIGLAIAAQSPDPIETGRLSAERRLGPLPCEVKVQRRALPGRQAGEAGYGIGADGTKTNCTVTIDTDQVKGAERCAIAKHEYLHILGFHEEGGPDDGTHSADPRDVMHSPLSMIPRQCRR